MKRGIFRSSCLACKRYIITGGPGSGKSTLLEALAAAGHVCYPEVSRELIREQSALPQGVLPWSNLPAFARLAIEAMMQQHDHALAAGAACFFDRAIPDIFGYLQHGGYPVPEHYLEAHARCSYERDLFMLPPWPEIYVNDLERPQSYEESVALYEALCRVYRSLGYRLHEVPKTSVEERTAYLFSVTK